MAGWSLSSGKDVDGDGVDDLLIGATDPSRSSSRAYLLTNPAAGTHSRNKMAALLSVRSSTGATAGQGATGADGSSLS